MLPVDTSRYVPDFEIKLDGEPLDLFCAGVKLYVMSLSIKETINQADSFEFTVAAHSHHLASFPTGRELACLDDERFGEGHKVEIRVGYVGNLALRFLGQISANSSNFPVTGIPTLTVRGFSRYLQLIHDHHPKPFDANTDSGIAQEIAAKVKLEADVDPTAVKHPMVSTSNKSCAEILKDRAERINYEVAVKENTLIFKKPAYIDRPSPTLPPLTWGQDLLSFQPHLSTYGIPSSVEVRSPQTTWGGDKNAIRGVCNTAELKPKLGKKSGMAQAARLGENKVLLQDMLVSTPEEARTVAEAYCRRKMLNFIQARGSSIGNPELVARQVIQLEGVGERFSGPYYVTETTHKIDNNGYRTDFECKRDGR
ncbi:hypothetical protein GC175_28110 [bacterium]|nr:hypothetical protein [bacterium]